MSFNLENSNSREGNETTTAKVDSEQLSKTEETAENYDACSLNEVQDSEGNEVNAESLETVEEDYEDCRARKEEIEEKKPELAEEDDFNDCGKENNGKYVAEVTYTTDGEVSQEEASSEVQEAYNECNDPEDMQQLKENANNNEHIEVENAELVEKPENNELDDQIAEAEYEEAEEKMAEAQENLEIQQEAAQEYQENLENQIAKHEDNISKENENINELPEETDTDEEMFENAEISVAEVEEIVEEKKEEIIEAREEQSKSMDNEIEKEAEQVAENEELTGGEAKEQISKKISESVNEEVPARDVEAMVEEKSETIGEIVKEKTEEQRTVDNIEVTADELEEDNKEQNPEQTERSLQERIDDAFEKEDVTASEIKILRDEHLSELQAKVEEKNIVESELKSKFNEVTTKESGSDEYRRSLQEYNALHDKKAKLDEQVATMEKQQDLLQKKCFELEYETQMDSTDNSVVAEEKTPKAKLTDYMNSHEYGSGDFDTYSQDPEWRELQRQAFPDYELPPISRESAYRQLGEYMREHNYGSHDFDKYSQDPKWRELQSYAFPDYELPPIKDKIPELEISDDLSVDEKAERIAEYKKALEDYCKSKDYVDTADFSDFDYRVAKDLTKSLEEAKRDFPELKVKYVGTIDKQVEGLHDSVKQTQYERYLQAGFEEELALEMANKYADVFIEQQGLKNTGGTYAWSLKTGDPVLGKYDGVAINDVFAEDYDLFKEQKSHDEELKWAPEGCGTPKSVTDHELGHEIDRLLDASNDSEIQKLYSDMLNSNPEDELSGYSAENIKEFIAEAYSEYKNNPNPRPLSKAVYNRLIELSDMKSK